MEDNRIRPIIFEAIQRFRSPNQWRVLPRGRAGRKVTLTAVRQRAWRVHIRIITYANSESIYQLAAEPTAYAANNQARSCTDKGEGARNVSRSRMFYNQASRKKEKHHDIETRVPRSDSLCSGIEWNSNPIDETKDCCEQSRHDAAGCVPVCHVGQNRDASKIKGEVGNPGRDQETQREHDDHLVDRMAEEFRLCFHERIRPAFKPGPLCQRAV